MKKTQKINKDNAVITKSAQKFKTIFVAMFCILFLTLILMLAFKIKNFVKTIPLQQIEVYGASNLLEQNIIQSLSPLLNNNLLSINLNDLKDYIESMGSVKYASIYRNLNGKLIITILEENPYFLWLNDEDNYKLINSKNNLVNLKLDFSLNRLITIEKGKLALENIEEIRFVIYKDLSLLKQIKKLEFNGIHWVIYLKNGIYIKVPENNIEKAYDTLLAFKKHSNFVTVKEYIDITSVNRVFYK